MARESERGYTAEDLELFVDFDRAAREIALEPCLIGAGAIQLGGDLTWKVRLARTTRDWDFAVRVESWPRYEELASALCTRSFRRAREAHRFLHARGGTLDVVPYGDLEHPPGSLEWPDGLRMNTTGFCALEEHHALLSIERLELRAASIPAIVGLKLLAYADRRPGILRDIQDVHVMLQQAEDCAPEARIAAEALERLRSGELEFSEVGAYLLGRDVGRTFTNEQLAPMSRVLAAAGDAGDRTVGDVLHLDGGSRGQREAVIRRLRSFRLGVEDR